MERETEVVVIGAGQSGLSAAYFLRRFGLDPGRGFVVLDRYDRPGGAWQHRWPTLTFTTVNGVYQLPGMPMPEPEPATPVADVIPGYFGDYEREHGLRVERPVSVRAVRSLSDGRLRVETDRGVWVARALVNATGTWEQPFWPRYPGQETFRGRQLHTADYRGPWEFADRRVIVVGGGISAIQHLIEIHPATAAVANPGFAGAAAAHWVTRRPPEWREDEFDEEFGREVVAMVDDRVRRGLRPRSVISATGIPLTPEIRAAREAGVLERLAMFERITPDGAVWWDGRSVEADVILWATGFRAALDHLAPLGLRGPRGGIVMDGTRVAADPRLHLVGYGPSASTIGANRAGRTAAREVLAYLRERGQVSLAGA